jgi:hypothetical protein
MSRIYPRARKLLVWLGGKDSFTQLGSTRIARLGSGHLAEAEQLSTWARFLEAVTLHGTSFEGIGLQEWVAIYAVIDLSWFRRT